MNVHEELLSVFPSAGIDHWQSDLYVRHTPEIWKWLQDNYEHSLACRKFIDNIEGVLWIDIPFAYDESL
jgi:hypothetical protein